MRARRTRTLAAGAAAALALSLTGCAAAADPGADSTASSSAGATAGTPAAAVVTENAADHDDPADYTWNAAEEVPIELDGTSATVAGEGVEISGGTVTITAEGTYRISGTLTDGQVIVDSADDGVVRLILDGASITSSTGAALAVLDAGRAVVLLEEGTESALTDAAEYGSADAGTEEPNAALFSAADLTIGGAGVLNVTGNSNDGIGAKDGLVISGGTIIVDATDDGIRGKDYLVVRGGVVTVTAGGDGLKSDNADDATMGYVSVEAGTLTVTSGGDGIDAETDVLVRGGQVTVTAGGGASASLAADASAKGLVGTVSVVLDGGALVVDSADDAVHSNGAIEIVSGEASVSTGDDAVHADDSLVVSGGTLTVTDSYEGLESATIAISGGDIEVRSSDDGINVAGGNDGSGQMAPGAGNPGNRGGPAAGPAADQFAASGDYWLEITGGTTVLYADGDGLDANGTATMTGGTVIVHGPTSDANGAIDVDGAFTVDAGLLVAAGSAGMAVAPGEDSAQAVLAVAFGSRVSAGTQIRVTAPDGAVVAAFTPAKDAATLVVSLADLVAGTAYDVVVAGASLGTVTAR